MNKAIANANRQCAPKAGEYARLLSGGMFVLGYALLLLIVRPVQAQSPPSIIDSGESEQNEASNPFADLAQAYRDFLAHPPWIKKIVFRRSGNQYIVHSGDTKKALDGYALYEGALQPSGFYVKHLENTIIYNNLLRSGRFRKTPPPPGREFVKGSSDRYYWDLSSGHERAALTPKRTQDGASPKNSSVWVYDWERSNIEKARRLGLELLTNAPVAWIDSDHFMGTTPDGEPVRGAIVRYEKGLPVEVLYSLGTNSFSIRYSYKREQPFPPYQIVYETLGYDVLATKKSVMKYTNYIEFLEAGVDASVSNGYKMSDFRAIDEPLQSLITWSNGVRFKVSQEGRWNKIDERVPSFADLREGFSRTAGAIIMVVAVAGLPTVIILARRWSKKQRMARAND